MIADRKSTFLVSLVMTFSMRPLLSSLAKDRSIASPINRLRTSVSFIYLIPMSALGVLLVFAGSQLARTILDLKGRKDLFVPLMMVGSTFASNLAVGLIAGIAPGYAPRSEKRYR